VSLKNFILPETFVTISHFAYEKWQRRCVASIDIFEDDSKNSLIGTTSVVIDGSPLCPEVDSVRNLKKYPPNPLSDLDKSRIFILPPDGEGDWANSENHVARYDPVSLVWVRWRLDVSPWFVYAADEQIYYQWTGFDWAIYQNMTSDRRIWDKFMAPEVSLIEGTNPVKQMYLFMKTLKKFQHCVDC